MRSILDFALIFWLGLVVSCGYAVVERQPPSPADILLEPVDLPDVVDRSQKINFVIRTSAQNQCVAGIGYSSTKNDHWITEEFLVNVADDEGLCQWNWVIPPTAKSGIAEFRLVVHQGRKARGITPHIFCIDECPEDYPGK